MPCLALQALTVEEARARQEKLAKMRSLLFYHELKARRLKKIKSKDFHRRLNRAAKRKVHYPFEDASFSDRLRPLMVEMISEMVIVCRQGQGEKKRRMRRRGGGQPRRLCCSAPRSG